MLDSELSQAYRAISDLIDWISVSLGADGSLRRDAVEYALQISGRDVDNSANDAAGALAVAQDYAAVAQAWAEHMPDTIPPNILAVMNITGDHWSARWWANRSLGGEGGVGVAVNLALSGNLTVAGTTTLTGLLTALGSAVVGLDLTVGRNVLVNQALTVYGQTISRGGFYSQNASGSNTLLVSPNGDLSMVGTLLVAGPIATSQGLSVAGATEIKGDLLVRSGFYVRTPAGADVFTVSPAGAVAAAKSVVVGDSLAVTNSVTIGAAASVNGNVQVGGAVAVGDSLAVTKSVTVGQFLNVSGGMRLNGISPYASNAAAIAAGHVTGDIYVNTATNGLMVVVGNP